MKLIALLLCCISYSQGIEGKYEFDFRENRTSKGWDKIESCGKIVFNNNEVTIITPNRVEQLYVKSKQLFIRQKSFLYTLVDDNYNECSFRIVVNDTLNTIDLYYYSDRVNEKYYKLKLKKCLYE
jgi:hypothetical protein